MKTFTQLTRSLALFLMLGLFMAPAYGQSPDATFGQIQAAVAKGDSEGLAKWFHSSVEVTLPGTDQAYSAQQAGFVFKDFFAQHGPKGFRIDMKGSSGNTWYATGVYTGPRGEYDVNIFLKKINGEFRITQIRFESA